MKFSPRLFTIPGCLGLLAIGVALPGPSVHGLLRAQETASTPAATPPVTLPVNWTVASPAYAEVERLITEKLQRAIAAGDIPGAVLIAGTTNETLLLGAVGHRRLVPRVEPLQTDDIFDLASLTKPLATTLAVMKLVGQGKLKLDDPVAKHWPEFGCEGKESITPVDLLLHRSGLIADNPLGDYLLGPEIAWQKIAALKLRQPVGTKFAYSDVGLLVMGKVVEKIGGQPLNQFCASEIYRPLGLERTGYLPPAAWAEQLVPTEGLPGGVHDPRAARLGGVAGHAGLFSDAQGVAQLSRAILRSLKDDAPAEPQSPRLFSQQTALLMTAPHHIPDPPMADAKPAIRALGWDMRSPYSSNRPTRMLDRAIGHGGFTGTTLWIDPERDLFVCILSSRLHPDGKGQINSLARELGDDIIQQFDSLQSAPPSK